MQDSATPPKTELDSPTKLDSPPEKIHDDYAAPATASNDYVTGWKLTVVCVAVALACFLMLIDTMIISTAIPRITDDFNSLVDIGWYASAYQYGSAAPQPLTGKVYTHFSSKVRRERMSAFTEYLAASQLFQGPGLTVLQWSFLLFFGIFELGSVLCGATTSSVMLIIGRTVAGIGGSGIVNGAIIIISGCVPQERRPALIGITSGFGQLGMIVGPLVGGAFTAYYTWRWCFYINLPIGAVVALAIALIHIPEQTPKANAMTILPKLHHLLDFMGFFLFAPAVLQLLMALQFGGVQYAWRSSQVIGLFCGAAATFTVWLFWNRRKGDDALLPQSLITRRVVWVSGLFHGLFMSAMFGAIYYLPIYFQAINGASAMQSGVYLLPTILPTMFMAGLAGVLIVKIGFVIPFALVATTLVSVASGLYSILQADSPTGWWVGFQIIGGIGTGLGLNLAIVSVQANVTGEELSSAMAFIVFAQSLGPSVFLALCNLIFVASLKTELPAQAPNVDAPAVVKAGATGFRAIVPESDLHGVLVAYANSVNRTFYLVATIAACCGIALWGMGWTDLRKKTSSTASESEKPSENDQTPKEDTLEKTV